MADFKVLREHIGDKPYQAGDTRKANPADVKRLVEMGVLEPKAKPASKAKAAPKLANKAERTLANK